MLNEYQERCFILIGAQIKNLREERNMSLKEISEKSGIRIEYFKKIENGTAYRLTLNKHLVKIADVLGVRMSELFCFENR